ncbi:heme-binding protein [Dechloromonas sp. ARDL1]|uniref:GlcG/HbpS family heme-binding protein n=1 Tax=Dechloromonas sp. ARDL1 TaxID=3322121 RepID=UPI003DA7061D
MDIRKLTALSLLFAMPFAAQAQLVDKKGLTLAEAHKAVVAATAEAKANNWNVVIAVVDDAGYPLRVDRLDNAQRPSVDIAIGKARTAALFRRPSAALEDAVNKGRPALLSAEGYIFMQGGVPIIVNGEVIGAVGVSGVRADQDEQVATAGVKVLGR